MKVYRSALSIALVSLLAAAFSLFGTATSQPAPLWADAGPRTATTIGSPFAVVWAGEPPSSSACDVSSVVEVVTGFMEAFNRGDLDAALVYFPDHDQQSDIDTTGLQWFFVDETTVYTPDDLRSFVSYLQADGEHWQLLRLEIGWSWHGGSDTHFHLTRSSNELEQRNVEGRASINCETGQIFVLGIWS